MRHVYRELNTRADELASAAWDRVEIYLAAAHVWPPFIRVYSDGSGKTGEAGIGWHVDGAFCASGRTWIPLAAASFRMPLKTTSVEAELAASVSPLKFLITAARMGVRTGGPRTDWSVPLLTAAARPQVWRIRSHGS